MSDLRDLVDDLNATICQKTGYTYDPDTDTFTDEEGQCTMAGWAVRRDWRSKQQWVRDRMDAEPTSSPPTYTYDPDTGFYISPDGDDLSESGRVHGVSGATIQGSGMSQERDKTDSDTKEMLVQECLHDRSVWLNEREKMAEELHAVEEEQRRVKDENLYLRGQVDALKWYIKETM